MKKPFATLLILLYSFTASKSEDSSKGSVFKMLVSVNTEWNKHVDACLFNTPVVISNDRIAMHLMIVEKNLRSADVSKLSAKQREKRQNLLNRLNQYWRAGVFPLNDYVSYTTPVFIDKSGTHCAVGYLMQQSGSELLAKKIAAVEKFAYVHAIKTSGVHQWADENGFTIDELAWIQPGYLPQTVFSALGDGTNGSVTDFYPVYSPYNQLIIAGSFTTLDNFPCLNIGRYQNNHLSCLGHGLEGKINDIATFNYAPVAAVGNIKNGTDSFAIATYDGLSWSFDTIPGRPGAIGSAIASALGSWKAEIAISTPTVPGKSEIWFLSDNDVWQKQATVNGAVFDIAQTFIGDIYVGVFDSVIVNRETLGDTLILAHNVIVREPHYNAPSIWFGINGSTSDTVLLVKEMGGYGGSIYFAGTCNAGAKSDICLTRYLNGTLQPLVLGTQLGNSSNKSVRTLDIYNSTSLICGGEFETAGPGNFATNLFEINPVTNRSIAVGAFDAPVNVLINWQNEIYFGGDFTSSSNNPGLSHLAKIDASTGIPDIENTSNVHIYPNPAFGSAVAKMKTEGDYLLQLLNTQGELIETFKTRQSAKINAEMLAPGVYFIRAINSAVESNASMGKFIVVH
jgi:hypothetical protein